MAEAGKDPYAPKESDSDLEKAYKDIMGGIDKAFQGATGSKEQKKDPKASGDSKGG